MVRLMSQRVTELIRRTHDLEGQIAHLNATIAESRRGGPALYERRLHAPAEDLTELPGAPEPDDPAGVRGARGSHPADPRRALPAGASGAGVTGCCASPTSGSTRCGCVRSASRRTATVTTAIFVMWWVYALNDVIAIGVTAYVSQLLGAGERARAGAVAAQGLRGSALLGLCRHGARAPRARPGVLGDEPRSRADRDRRTLPGGDAGVRAAADDGLHLREHHARLPATRARRSDRSVRGGAQRAARPVPDLRLGSVPGGSASRARPGPR